MNDRRISFMMKLDPFTSKIWCGFLAPDIILSKHPSPPFPHLYVMNTAPSNTRGEHWCVLLIFDDCCEFFDSFGFSPSIYGLDKSMFNQCSQVVYNGTQFQGFDAKTCGHYCIFYAMQRARNVCPNDIKKMFFGEDYKKNDEFVYKFVQENFGDLLARIE